MAAVTLGGVDMISTLEIAHAQYLTRGGRQERLEEHGDEPTAAVEDAAALPDAAPHAR